MKDTLGDGIYILKATVGHSARDICSNMVLKSSCFLPIFYAKA
jgi:hypothetical protein